MNAVYRLNGLDCANCAAKIESKIKKLKGVKSASVNFLTCKMTLESEAELSNELINEAEGIVHSIEPDVKLERVK